MVCCVTKKNIMLEVLLVSTAVKVYKIYYGGNLGVNDFSVNTYGTCNLKWDLSVVKTEVKR